MVNIYLMGVDQNYYFKFKTSMISQLNVDYSPGGLSINKGGKPSQVGITMTLNEAFIHTAEDYSVKELIQEEIQEAIDDRIVDILTSNDGETREFNPDTVQTSDGQPLNVTNTSDVRSDEVLVTRTLPDGSTSSQILTQTELINQGFGEQVAQLQASPGNTVATGIDGVEFTKGS